MQLVKNISIEYCIAHYCLGHPEHDIYKAELSLLRRKADALDRLEGIARRSGEATVWAAVTPEGKDIYNVDKLSGCPTLLDAVEKVGELVTHGVNCHKAAHKGTGWEHVESDDRVVHDAEGMRYCRRCHLHYSSDAEVEKAGEGDA